MVTQSFPIVGNVSGKMTMQELASGGSVAGAGFAETVEYKPAQK